MDHKKILDQQIKISQQYSNNKDLIDYLVETMDNFYYRYLETTLNKNLHTHELASHVLGAQSTETNSMEILKIKNPNVKPHLIEAAKMLGAKGGLTVTYRLSSELKEISPEKGLIIIQSLIDWSANAVGTNKSFEEKKVVFEYHSLGEFRKNLALKLEEACEIFL